MPGRKTPALAVALAFTVTSFLPQTPALAAMPVAKSLVPVTASQDSSALVQKVQSRGRRWRKGKRYARGGRGYRGKRGYRGGRRYYRGKRYYGGRRYYYGGNYYNPGAAAAAGIIGLATGAIIAGSLAQPRYSAPAPVYRRGAYAPWTPEWYSYCSSRYRSFNPDTGYFLAYSGQYRFCY